MRSDFQEAHSPTLVVNKACSPLLSQFLNHVLATAIVVLVFPLFVCLFV